VDLVLGTPVSASALFAAGGADLGSAASTFADLTAVLADDVRDTQLALLECRRQLAGQTAEIQVFLWWSGTPFSWSSSMRVGGGWPRGSRRSMWRTSFARPKVFSLPDWAAGQPILDAFARFNALIEQAADAADVGPA
jgi:hypothetical protein